MSSCSSSFYGFPAAAAATFSYFAKILLSAAWFSSTNLEAFNLLETETGRSLRSAEIRSGVAPTATHAPHSDLESGTVLVRLGKY
jgi:hypothetical protein